jgi:predicted Zn-dependent protease
VNELRGESRLFETLEAVLRASPADGTEVVCEGGLRNLVRFARSTLHQGMVDRSGRVTVRVHLGRRVGQATVGSRDPDALRGALDRALAAARATRDDPSFPGLPEPRPLQSLSLPAFDAPTAAMSVAEKADLLERCFAAAEARGATLAGRFHTSAEEMAVVSSSGVRAYHAGTRAEAAFFAEAGGATGFAGDLARDAGHIDALSLATLAVETALAARDPAPLEPGAYDVVLAPAAVADVLEWMALVCLTARSVEDGSSFAADGFGRRVTGERITLYDEGASDLPEAIPQPFDVEGMPKGRLDLLRQGVVVGVAHDTRSAVRAGAAPTGHAAEDFLSGERLAVPTHLILEGGDDDAASLCARVERGVYVSRFHYVCGTLDPRRASMTGMTRDGTFLIEDGRIARAVGNLRWSEALLAALERVQGISRARQAVPGFWGRSVSVVPSLLVRGWTFTARQEEA